MALVTPAMAAAMTAGGAELFRQHFAKKANFVRQVGPSQTKRVNTKGFNPYGILFFARKTNNKNVKTPNELLIRIGNYTYDDYVSFNLPEPYYRWSADNNCMEIAKKRWIAKGEKLDKDKGDAAYYPDADKLSYVPIPPGSIITLSDFQWVINKDRENAICRVMDLFPKMKSPKAMEDYPNEPDFQWNSGSINAKIFDIPPAIFPGILFSKMDSSLFHLDNPTREGHFQRFVMLKMIDWFEDGALEKEIASPTFTLTKLIHEGGDDAWSYENKESKELNGFITILPPAGSSGQPKKKNTKRMSLFAVAEQKPDPNSTKIQTISVKLNMWDEAVEEIFAVRDVALWVNVMKFVASHIAPAILICTVGKERTASSGWNTGAAATDGDAEGGEYLTLRGEEDNEDGGDPSANPAANPENAGALVVAGTEAADVDFSKLIQEQQTKVQDAVKLKEEKVDYFLDVTVVRGIVPLFDVYKNFLIPVTVPWVVTVQTDPATGKKIPRNYIALSSGKHPDIEISRMASLPEVICVSEHMKHIQHFNELVNKKKGEYRVVVNTPTYVNETNAKSFIQAIRTLTAAEGSDLLDGKPVKNISWTRPETAQYILFFLNYAARSDAKIDEMKVKTLEAIAKYNLNPNHTPANTGQANQGDGELLPDAPATGGVEVSVVQSSVSPTLTPTAVASPKNLPVAFGENPDHASHRKILTLNKKRVVGDEKDEESEEGKRKKEKKHRSRSAKEEE